MALTTYCAYDEVRAALGVNGLELGDAVLALPVYEIGLVRELSKISSSLPAAFSALPPSDLTAVQQAFKDAVRMFAAYSVAKQAGASLATFAPKDVGDGKANLSRWAGTPYETTMENVKLLLGDARDALSDAYDALIGVTTTPSSVPVHFINVGRTVDPVTGS
jgi:hypothetical protein